MIGKLQYCLMHDLTFQRALKYFKGSFTIQALMPFLNFLKLFKILTFTQGPHIETSAINLGEMHNANSRDYLPIHF